MTTVLITRPLTETLQLAEQLQRVGVGSIAMPLYEFSANRPDFNIKAALAATSGRKLIVFTSPRAVRFGLAHLPEDIRAGLEIAVVGAATGRQLEEAGLAVNWIPGSGFTSEDLLVLDGLRLRNDAIGTQNADDAMAIIMAAPGGREALQTGLQAMGWVVNKAFVYRRQDLLPDTQTVTSILTSPDLLSVWTSTSAITAARKNLPAEAWSKIVQAPALVISSRIKHHLEQLGVQDITLTDGPGNVDLLQSICKFAGMQRSPSG